MIDGVMSTDRCCRSLEAAGYAVRTRVQGGESAPLIEAEPK